METRSNFGLGCNVPRHLAPSHVALAAREACAVAVKAEQQKSRKYCYLCTTHYFSPFAVETSGALGPEALSLLSDIGPG